MLSIFLFLRLRSPHVTQDLSLASSQNSQNSVPDPNPPPPPLMLQLNLYLFVFIISLQPMAFPPVMEVGTSSHNKCIFAPLRAYIIYFGGHISLCEGLCMCHKHIPESARRALCIYVWASLHILRGTRAYDRTCDGLNCLSLPSSHLEPSYNQTYLGIHCQTMKQNESFKLPCINELITQVWW